LLDQVNKRAGARCQSEPRRTLISEKNRGPEKFATINGGVAHAFMEVGLGVAPQDGLVGRA
jgi:hypothetical protein